MNEFLQGLSIWSLAWLIMWCLRLVCLCSGHLAQLQLLGQSRLVSYYNPHFTAIYQEYVWKGQIAVYKILSMRFESLKNDS